MCLTQFYFRLKRPCRCIFFDPSQKDTAGDWALRTEKCDPNSGARSRCLPSPRAPDERLLSSSGDLDPKFLWSYSDMAGDAGDALEAKGWCVSSAAQLASRS